MQRRTFIKDTIMTSVGLLVLPDIGHSMYRRSSAQSKKQDFGAFFDHPPDDSRPWCFWQWMNGHITATGITEDLEAMKRMGVGGALCFNSAVGIPRGPVDYASPEWTRLTVHAAREAKRLGLQLALHNSPGYSGAGGPWITPEMSMQELVWSETRAAVSVSEGAHKTLDLLLARPYAKMDYYEDTMVLAYPCLPGEGLLMRDAVSRIRCNGKDINKEVLTDGNPETKIRWRAETPRVTGAAQKNEKKTKKVAVLDLIFEKDFTARAISLLRKPETPKDLFDGPRDFPPKVILQYALDGKSFHDIGQIPLPELRAMDTY